jgi:hypothetical protein
VDATTSIAFGYLQVVIAIGAKEVDLSPVETTSENQSIQGVVVGLTRKECIKGLQ